MSSNTTVGKVGSNDIKWYDGVNTTFTRLTSTGGTLTQTPVGTVIDVLEAYGGGDSYTQTSLALALGQVGTSRTRALLLKVGTWAITSNLTIPANVTLIIPPGTTISIATGVTLTFSGCDPDAGPYTIFTLTGTGAVAGLSRAYAEWFGVSSSASAANNSTYMQAAVNAMSTSGGHLVLVTPGTYSAGAKVSLLSNLHLTLGEGVTWSSSGGFVVFEALGVDEVTTYVGSAAALGATTLTVNNAGALAADDAVFVFNETADGKCDFSLLSAVASNDLTLETPLSNAWTGAATQLVYGGTTYKHDIVIDGRGKIQDLSATTSTILVSLQNSYNCMVKDLSLETYRSAGAGGTLVSFGQSTSSRKAARCTMQNLNGYGNPGNAYVTYYNTSECRVIDCIPPVATNPFYLQGDNLLLSGIKTPLNHWKDTDTGFKKLKLDATGDHTIAITADWIDVTDGFTTMRLYSFSETLDCTTTGANGLQADSLANDTFYYVYAIAKPDGTQDSFASTSATPTLPTGYTHYRNIGTPRTDSSANFYGFVQYNDVVQYDAQHQDLTGGTSGTWADVSLTYIPTIAISAMLRIAMEVDTASVLSVGVDGANGLFAVIDESVAHNFEIYLLTAQTVKYIRVSGSGTLYIATTGYRLPIR